MDVFDQATDREEKDREACLKRAREACKPIPVSDTCWQCGEDTLNGARWCSTYCRDRWDTK